MLKILVTGANGFVGKHLVHELYNRGHKVIGVGHKGLVAPEVKELLEAYLQCDLTDKEQVAALPLQDIDAMVNLAGLANAGASFADPETYKRINVEVLTVPGERLLEINSKARVVAISTGAVYDPAQSLPLTEDSPLAHTGSPYVESKILMEKAAGNLRKRGSNCVIARPFNHFGPGQAEGYLIPDLYTKIQVAKNSGQPIKVGNLESKRDYTDVRDIVKAYADLAVSESLRFDTYNVCSNTSHTGREMLDLILKELAVSKEIVVQVDQSLIRPSDPKDLRGSYARINKETGWEPAIPLEQTIRDFIAWRDDS